ncbi:hypothetical protein NCC49_003127 [Naganishia albida]|nr:hypothetical protein NCC49_003127 [Naganishia albida]
MSSNQARYVARLFNTPPLHTNNTRRHRASSRDRDRGQDAGTVDEVSLQLRKGSVAESESMARSSPATTFGTLPSIVKTEDPDLLGSSGTLTETRAAKLNEKQAMIQESLTIGTSATRKLRALNSLRRLIATSEKSMSRSKTYFAVEIDVADASPRLTDGARELLLWACQVLQALMGHEERALVESDKVETWMPEAATLFGRALANLFASSPDHDFSQPESLYQQVALQFSLQVQRSANELVCTSCSPTHTHALNTTQLKLLIVLLIHGSLWIHAKVFAESYLVDCMWHIAQALHSCQGKLRDRSHQLLGRILRAYGTCQGRAIKGIEILAVTSYDAAFDGLIAQGSATYRQHSRTIPVEFLLDTMIVLWMKPSHSLRYQLESIRQDRYYNVEALWRAIEPHVNDRKQTDNAVRLLCELLPLMAFWSPTAMTTHLDPVLRFLTERKAAQALPQTVALGKIVQAAATEVLPMLPRIAQFLLEAIETNSKSDVPFDCATRILQSLGPTATSEMGQVIASVERAPIRGSSMDFLTAVPLLIPALTKSVNDYFLRQLSRLREAGASVNNVTEWLAVLRVLPRISIACIGCSGSEVESFLLASLQGSAPTDVILEGLQQCSDVQLCTRETSGEIVNHILALISKRQEPAILDASFRTISHEHLGFDAKSVSYPLLLQLMRPNLQVQRVVAKLLTIQAIKFPSLIIPVLRTFMRSSLITIDTDETKTSEWKLQTVGILCIILPALPPALSKLYSKPILAALTSSLKACNTVGKGCKICLEAIGHLTRSCAQIWTLENLRETVGELQRLGSYASPTELARVLSCMASLMSIPASSPLQEEIMQYTFRQYLFGGTVPEPIVRAAVVSVLGSIGTADRNPITNRSHLAAMKRVEGIYDVKLKRRIATAVTRDKRGVRSLEYKLSMISDNLSEALQRRSLASKIPIWHVIMKLSLMLREEYVVTLPDITGGVIDEIIQPSVATGGRNHRPKMIALLSQTILLRPNTTYEEHWSRLLPALRAVVADPDAKSNALWSVLLMALSIISRYKRDLAPVTRDVLPLVLQTAAKAMYLDKETLIFSLKLIAGFQSHCNRYVGNIGELLEQFVTVDLATDETVLAALAEFLAHLGKWIGLFEISIAVESVLQLVSELLGERADIANFMQEIRISTAFCPEIPQQQGPSVYPDFRDYTDAQFMNLALQPQERAQAEYNTNLWHFEEDMDYLGWQQWQSRMEYSILAACQVDIFFVACGIFTDIPRGILHAAFVSLWDLLEDKQKAENGMIRVLQASNTPENVKSIWLSILQFLHRCSLSRLTPKLLTATRKSFAFDAGSVSTRCDPLVLWYAEIDSIEQLDTRKSVDFARLIETNIRVGIGSFNDQRDVALSTIDLAAKENGLAPRSDWLIALSRWDQALVATKREMEEGDKDAFSIVNNQTISHFARLDFAEVHSLASEYYDEFSLGQRERIAQWNAVASWAVGDFLSMSHYLTHMKKGSSKILYKAVLEIHHGDHVNALEHITKAKALVYDELWTRTGYHDFSASNYTSAMKTLAKAEMLCEMEEVIRYKEFSHKPEIQAQYRDAWLSRIRKAHPNVNSFYKRMMVWSLAADTVQLRDAWLHLAKLCQEQHVGAGRRILDELEAADPTDDKTRYARLRFEWAATRPGSPARPELLDQLKKRTLALSEACGLPSGTVAEYDSWSFPAGNSIRGGTQEQRLMLSRHLMRLGSWTKACQGEDWAQDPDLKAYRYTKTAVALDPEWYSVLDQFTEYALDLLDIKYLENGDEKLSDESVELLVLPACYSMFQSISLQHTAERTLKQTLLAITVWFRYGANPKVLQAFHSHLKKTQHKAWLHVLPQLIARLGAKDERLRASLLDFLLAVARSFPHAVIWPLLTVAETPRSIHQTAAREIMEKMRDNVQIARMAQVVATELNRTALSFAERWKAAMEKIIYIDGLTPYTWAEVLDEYVNLESPQSEEEYLFVQKYGDSLWSAKVEVERYFHGSKASYYKACGEYQMLYRKIHASLEGWRRSSFQLNLRLVAPRLTSIEDSNLIVPGEYDPSADLLQQPFITRFDPMVDVINTKQLPRKLQMRSDKGKFVFLLKGNEDLRQDERVMQLITLTNMLLSHNSNAFDRQLFIQPYSAIPLGSNSGLLSWLSNTETLMQMISSSRNKIKGDRTSDNELAAMMGMDPQALRQSHLDYDKMMQKYHALPMEKKLEQYRNALAQSDQNDLKNLLWRRSSSSQTWLSRRTTFARSVATTSMIGYVIGLGDRHPGNTLVEQTKFNAISIDFGDVFEAAHDRTPYPEKVPFRLTPQITNAFEFAAIYGKESPGSRGHFHYCSVLTMGIMRKHRTSLLAMLEAFAYDPLLNWQAKEVENQAKRLDEQPVLQASSSQGGKPRAPAEDKPVIRQDELQAKFDKQISRVKSLTISLGGSFIAAGSARNPLIKDAPNLTKILEEADADVPESVTSRDGANGAPATKLPEAVQAAAEVPTPEGEDMTRRASKPGAGGSKNSEGYFARMAGTMTNDRALKVLTVIERKLQGRDVPGEMAQTVEEQVQRLIQEATNHKNLAQGYVLGWMPWS